MTIELYKTPRQPDRIIDCDAINRICDGIFTMPGDLDDDKAEMLIDELTYATEDKTIIPALQEIKPMIQKGNYKTAAALANDVWLIYRRGGIGGSDASSIMGNSKWRTALELYYDKIGEKPNEVIDEGRQYIFDFGHAMEAFVAEHYQKVFMEKYKAATELAFSLHYGKDIRIAHCRVYRDTWMYKSPEHPFMRADLDFKIDFTFDNGKTVTGIFECKTTSPFTIRDGWEAGPPKYYEVQTRHYMAVMDVPFAIIACAADNSAANYYCHPIFRDAKTEADLIEKEEAFWDCVQNKTPPYEIGVNNLAVLLEKSDEVDNGDVVADQSPEIADMLQRYAAIEDEIKLYKDFIKDLDSKKSVVLSDILTYMTASDTLKLVSELDGLEYNISVNEKCSNAVDWKKFAKALAKAHPVLAQEIEDTQKACLKDPKPKKVLTIKATAKKVQKGA